MQYFVGGYGTEAQTKNQANQPRVEFLASTCFWIFRQWYTVTQASLQHSSSCFNLLVGSL